MEYGGSGKKTLRLGFCLQATMPKMVQEIQEAYMEHMGKPAKTLGYPGKCQKKSMEMEDEVKTTQYQSIVGKLM